MPRLRPLHIGTETLPDGTVRDRTVLVLDHISPGDLANYSNTLKDIPTERFPSTMAFVGNVDLPDSSTEYLALDLPKATFPRTILVVGADRDDAHALIQAFETASGEQCVSATPQTGLPYGMTRPAMVLYTAAFQALPAGKRHWLEEQVRTATANP